MHRYNGRYLMMGFASNKVVADEQFIVPRRIALGNLKLCGVLLSYQEPDALAFLKTGMGWNFIPRQFGAQIMDEIVSLVLFEKGQAGDWAGRRLRGDTCGHRHDGKARHCRPHRGLDREVTVRFSRLLMDHYASTRCAVNQSHAAFEAR